MEGSIGFEPPAWMFTERSIWCTGMGCMQAFTKHHHPRPHIPTTHSPAGTKGYELTRGPMTRSGTLARIRPASRCPPCYFFPRERNFKLCPYPECNGKSFIQQKGLKAHLKIHGGRAIEGRLNVGGIRSMMMNRRPSRERAENMEGIGSVTVKDARRTSTWYSPPLDSVIAFS